MFLLVQAQPIEPHGGMAKLADALDLGSSVVRRADSSSVIPTIWSYNLIGKIGNL